MATFADITNHWAQAFIAALADRGLISGFPDGSFQPDRPLTRAQFAALLVRSVDRPSVRSPRSFRDVAANHWARAAIQQAWERGLLSGYPDGSFRPDATIVRADVLVALVNGLGLTGGETLDLSRFFDDAGAIATYARQPVQRALHRRLVANFPNLRQLRPSQASSRAEVATMLYQALVADRNFPAIDSPYLVEPGEPPPQLVNLSHRRELRAAWIASVWNVNWPSKAGLSSAQQQAELVTLLDRAAAARLNAIFLQIRPEGDALYDSSIEPWSRWLTGTQGRAPNPYYDPLAFAIEQCRQRNLELHAWFNPYRARTSLNAPIGTGNHVEAVYPNAVYTYGTQRWMDPGLPEVQNRAVDVVLDVVRRYDIDGIHLDDYFYPYPVEGQEFPDRQTYWSWGGGKTLADWRRDNVNKLVKRLSEQIRSVKPWVKFGISPFGIYRPGEPAGIVGLDQYDRLFADPKWWLKAGWLDYVAPQLYWRIDQTAQSYRTLLNWWVQIANGAHVYPGNNLDKLGSSSAWSVAEFEQQITLTRELAAQRALGNAFYNIEPIAENRQGFADQLRQELYAQPALPPVLRATGNPPSPPTGVRVNGGELTWAAGGEGLRGWALYRQQGNSWTLDRLLAAGARSLALGAGTYALCAVDRSARESQGVVVTLR